MKIYNFEHVPTAGLLKLKCYKHELVTDTEHLFIISSSIGCLTCSLLIAKVMPGLHQVLGPGFSLVELLVYLRADSPLLKFVVMVRRSH